MAESQERRPEVGDIVYHKERKKVWRYLLLDNEDDDYFCAVPIIGKSGKERFGLAHSIRRDELALFHYQWHPAKIKEVFDKSFQLMSEDFRQKFFATLDAKLSSKEDHLSA